MKNINLWYWIVTILFAGFMIFTAIPNILNSAESIDLISTQLGYPTYIIPFIGVAKLVGSLVVLTPGLNRLKEWAYAGLLFDLVGAIYSGVAKFGFQPPMVTLLVPIAFLFISHYLWHKKQGSLKES